MNRISFKMLSALAVLVLFVASVPLFAQKPYDITIRAGDEVAVPGHLLSPGHYSLQQVDSLSTGTYRLTNEDTMRVIGVFHVIPDERHKFGQTSVTLSDPDAAGLRTIEAWYPAGGMQGYQFVYSHKDLRKLDQMARAQEQVTGSAAGQP